MTYSSHKKALKQLRNKPDKLKKFLKHNAPKERTTGQSRLRCRRCLRSGAYIGKYGLNLCRQCFREIAPKIGFKKFH
ncbi:30S ribosomal protein S14 [Candidatus Woesearchaeota archaeon]|nr:30S ribosomal protein S14 [Candidatus Woesearchaeota archaeon]